MEKAAAAAAARFLAHSKRSDGRIPDSTRRRPLRSLRLATRDKGTHTEIIYRSEDAGDERPGPLAQGRTERKVIIEIVIDRRRRRTRPLSPSSSSSVLLFASSSLLFHIQQAIRSRACTAARMGQKESRGRRETQRAIGWTRAAAARRRRRFRSVVSSSSSSLCKLHHGGHSATIRRSCSRSSNELAPSHAGKTYLASEEKKEKKL